MITFDIQCLICGSDRAIGCPFGEDHTTIKDDVGILHACCCEECECNYIATVYVDRQMTVVDFIHREINGEFVPYDPLNDND